jgi:hypothetical protein
MLAEIGGNPLNAEDLAAVLVVNYFDAAIGQAQALYLWVAEGIGIDIDAVVPGNCLPQVIDIDIGQLLYDWPWPRIAWALCSSQLRRHWHN